MNDSLRRAMEKRDNRNVVPEEYFELNFDVFMQRIYDNCDPNVYGLLPVKKIQRDSNNMFLEVSSDKNIGDGHINRTEFFEVKVSYLPKKTKKYNIKNIRKYQNVDYYILILVDENMKSNIYCVHKDVICDNPILTMGFMSQTKEINTKNQEQLYSTTIKSDEVDWILGRKNELMGTSYNDLMVYIKNTYRKTVRYEQEVIIPTTFMRNKKSKVTYDVNGIKIRGRNNMESMINLVNFIGPKKLDGVLWESKFSSYPHKDILTPLRDGYYINPNFSLRDIHKVIKCINNKTNYNVRIETNY